MSWFKKSSHCWLLSPTLNFILDQILQHTITFLSDFNNVLLFQGNYAKFLKNLHSEQINKLVMKNQHECDLLEDIRTFTIKRSAIEKSYSEVSRKLLLK